MTVTPDRLLGFLHGMTSQDASQRELHADMVVDLVHSYSQREVEILSRTISLAASVEENFEALEAELHALLELGSSGFLDEASLSHLRDIDRTKISGTLLEYVDDLLGVE